MPEVRGNGSQKKVFSLWHGRVRGQRDWHFFLELWPLQFFEL
jgi:hypothetical protein